MVYKLLVSNRECQRVMSSHRQSLQLKACVHVVHVCVRACVRVCLLLGLLCLNMTGFVATVKALTHARTPSANVVVVVVAAKCV